MIFTLKYMKVKIDYHFTGLNMIYTVNNFEIIPIKYLN